MKHIKQITSLLVLLALLLTSALLVACNPENETTGSQPDADSGTTSATKNDAESSTPDPNENKDPEPVKPTYTITVVDQDGNPIKDALLQFCYDGKCVAYPTPTDENGKLVITNLVERSDYEVSVISAPSQFDIFGNAENSKKHTFDANHSLTITLIASEAPAE